MNRLFPGIIPVKGYKHTAFYDLDRQKYIRLLNETFTLNNINKTSLSYNVIENIRHDSFLLLNQNDMLINNTDICNESRIEYIQNYEWDTPSLISNAIIEISETNKLMSIELFKRLIECLSFMIANHIHINISCDNICMKDLEKLFEVLNESHIQTIQITLPYNEMLYSDEFGELIINNGKIIFAIVENSPINESYRNKLFFIQRKLKYTNNLCPENFRVNVFLYSESLKYNTYFNKKIYIDKFGNIKNSPESIKSFGVFQKIINFEDFYEKIKSDDFCEVWKSNKDSCETCKDCEYRYMCVDNRIPVKIGENHWRYESDCNYNPYLGKWKSE
ncbi:MAG TPA: hypothetical protein PKK00_14295 [Bacteroidales bacterium]|nr:hypothetical protein [Bacteroidales bacterium]HPS18358.1 hypothetical protein [Bacteroidales bacterium]